MKKYVVITLMVTMMMIMSGCGKSNTGYENSLPSADAMVESSSISVDVVQEPDALKEQTDYLTESIEEDGFQSDYVSGEENKSVLSKRAVKQGQWIYYYNGNEIAKMDAEGNVHTVMSIRDVYTVGVIGDWIYYAKYDEIGRVRTDGMYNEVLVEGQNIGKVFIDKNLIYYFSTHAVSATSSVRNLYCYDTEEKTIAYTSKNLEYPVEIIGKFYGQLYMREIVDGTSRIGYLKTDSGEVLPFNITLDNGEVQCFQVEGYNGAYIHDKKMVLSCSTGWNENITDIYELNLNTYTVEYHLQFGDSADTPFYSSTGVPTEICGIYEDNLGVVSWVVLVDNSVIYLVDELGAKFGALASENTISGQKIIEEDKTKASIQSAYVEGDYVYYWINEHLYRVDINGNNWGKLY